MVGKLMRNVGNGRLDHFHIGLQLAHILSQVLELMDALANRLPLQEPPCSGRGFLPVLWPCSLCHSSNQLSTNPVALHAVSKASAQGADQYSATSYPAVLNH